MIIKSQSSPLLETPQYSHAKSPSLSQTLVKNLRKVTNTCIYLAALVVSPVAFVAAIGGALHLMNNNITSPLPVQASVIGATGAILGGIAGIPTSWIMTFGGVNLHPRLSQPGGDFDDSMLIPITGWGIATGAMVGGALGAGLAITK